MNTKYPIILVHGIILKDFLFFKSFGKIDHMLSKQGLKVYKSKIDGFGTIETNAKKLQEEIEEILKKEKCEKVNIIAHSKGGLDSVYMINNLNMSNKVASLTTLCTPHKGSPIATNILKFPRWILKFIAFWINFWFRIFGDKYPDSLKVCEQLSLVDEIENEVFKVPETIYVQSYSTKMEKAHDDFVMGIPYMFSRYFTKSKNNDGLVGEESTKFGEYKGYAFNNDSISHSEIVDFMVKKKKKDKIYAFYISICDDLKNRGF